MTRDDIIRMAREAGFYSNHPRTPGTGNMIERRLERFAALVAAHERNRKWTQAHWTEYERSIAAAEREACAKVCEELQGSENDEEAWKYAAAAIRARGD